MSEKQEITTMQIQGLTRQLILQDLIMIGCVSGTMDVSEFVRCVYPKANEMPTTDQRFNMKTAIDDIRQHMDNNDDWTYEYLFFQYLKLLEIDDSDFKYFLENYVRPNIRRFQWDSENGSRVFFDNTICVDAINKSLKHDGFEMRQTDSISGFPVFCVESLEPGVQGKIKNIIFASNMKPDIVFEDAISNNIRIVGNEDQCLVFDEPVSAHGITWSMLQEWYNRNHYLIDRKIDMKGFLSRSLGSPIEERFFKAYVELAEKNSEIPALLPQVWLYYDPKLEASRIRKIFEHQRMDFLMLISDSRRIVIELDGIQHYGEKIQIQGRIYPDYLASVDKYASMVSAQRDMTLAGYEVYRFGGKELTDNAQAKNLVQSFFIDLFTKHGIPV
ncbi:MAG: hypothetical protein IKM73_13625 [Acidaminococcaceae bacterium]|nr:hypothetical protein [Acidaminococcaceae bacterium]